MGLKYLARRLIRRLRMMRWMADVKLYPGTEGQDENSLILFSPAIRSQNMGDSIIEYYCNQALRDVMEGRETYRLPTHSLPEADQMERLRRGENKIVCGTNLITPHFEEFSNWKMPENLTGYRDIVTLGVGWGYYCDTTSATSRFVYNTILSRDKLHSVRDGYTERKFREMGIHNVVNTGCPTLWELTPEHCATIPIGKAGRVITTLTDYDRDVDRDRRMIEILKANYDEVFVWIQGTEDLEYLESLVDTQTVRVIPRNLEAYTSALKMGNVDYVGTRLHAGIHAMNLGVRTVILAVDSRAIEMGRDFNLPVIRREDLEEKLQERICGSWNTQIDLPVDSIAKWKKQFTMQVNGGKANVNL